jgi:hypothetical protein
MTGRFGVMGVTQSPELGYLDGHISDKWHEMKMNGVFPEQRVKRIIKLT